ncbi:hypothetical protein ERO13_A08G063600v2 [Gossypium hirsutum]|uniref:Uncharacterized protein n=4 Tax=Gossypium TaxID=3633 RepID=A0A5J5UN14_GOSBA|nr:hypothetical protein ES319_A08G070400v1 [Gossypium barbadense]KAG4186763.1 hypothetical protein ERO13_A08G063600v2 [Gossypium hirsutum]TYH05338.1 hypothetical protein ES288_A08G075400v1 [Gossypium darwinii]TYI13711.1 hypothetical protein ES332_A08G076500v1 [Gossypium tomentosum]TYJ21610.1 hypothetical protein E1A91_A08G074300v1 [Gossypium mustelinum]
MWQPFSPNLLGLPPYFGAPKIEGHRHPHAVASDAYPRRTQVRDRACH